MQLWADAAAIVLIALLIDRFAGEPSNRFHPLRWIGNLLDRIDSAVGDRGRKAVKWGFLAYVTVFLMVLVATLAVTAATRMAFSATGIAWTLPLGMTVSLGEIAWVAVSGVFLKFTFSIFSFREHCTPIQDDLRAGRVTDAADKVRMIVSRDTAGMDAVHIASSCCETVTENLVDSVVSPALYGGLLGIPGAIMFRCANMMDAMWGYLNGRYGNLGFFVARFDDLLGYLTSRLSPYLVACAARLMGLKGHPSILDAAREEHAKTPSPNSGYPMAACAAALGISMEKQGVYVIGTGESPTVDDISRCCRLVELTAVLSVLAVMLPLYALTGIHVQVFLENMIEGVLRCLL